MGQHNLALSYSFDNNTKLLSIKLKNSIDKDIILCQEKQPYDGSSVIEIYAYDQKDSIVSRLRTSYIDDFPAIIRSKITKSCNKNLENLKTEISKNIEIVKLKIRFIIQSYIIDQSSKEVEYNWK